MRYEVRMVSTFLGIGAFLVPVLGAQNKAYSRTAWLAEAARSVRISSGLLPTARGPAALPIRPLDKATQPAGLVRVNRDLLGPEGASQAETEAEPYVAVDPSDPLHLLAGYQVSRFEDGGARALGFSTSFDGGASWTDGLIPNATIATSGPWERTSDPWVAFGADGRAYFASLLFNNSTPDNAIGVSTSDDGGLTWGPPVEVYRTVQPFNDKEAIVVDTLPSSPYFGTVYATWDIVERVNGEFRQRLVVSRSSNGGRTWSAPVRVRKNHENVGSIPRVGPDGTVYLVWTGTKADLNRETLFFSRSRDGGGSWTKPKSISRLRSTGAREFRSGEALPSFDVDASSGVLYVVWADRRWTGADQVTMSVSRNAGAAWSDPERVSDAPDDVPIFTPSVASFDGSVAVSYYSLQNDAARRFVVDVYLRRSGDGGATFAPSDRVTPQSFDGRFAARADGALFLGDYQGLAACSNGAFQLVFVAPLLPSAANPSRLQPDVFAFRANN